MARKAEVGLDYFPVNTNIIYNPKVKLVVAEFGSKTTWTVLLPLYCKIYREKGYWIDWFDEDSKLLFAQDDCKVALSVVNEFVDGCIRRSLFDKRVFDLFGILTSERIQANYIEATKRRKEVELIDEFLLKKDDVNINLQNVNIISLAVNILSKKVDIGTQKKSKVKEKEDREEKADKPPSPKIAFEEREKNFKKELVPFVDTYGKEMIRSFYDYWREPNRTRTKMRCEQQKTWDLSLRLKKWSANDTVFSGTKNDSTSTETKMHY